MNLGFANFAIAQTHCGYTFSLAPAAFAIVLRKTIKLADS